MNLKNYAEPVRAKFEDLEQRRLLSVAVPIPGGPVIAESGGVLRVAATDFADVISVGIANDHAHVEVKISNAYGTNIDDTSFPLAGLTRIRTHGLGGNDTISINESNGQFSNVQIVIFGDAGNDSIIGETGTDTSGGFQHNDSLYGAGGNDTIAAGNGNNLLLSGAGDDSITAGDGNNLIFGYIGSDRITTGNGNNLIDSGAGDDTVSAGDGANLIFGRGGNDSLSVGVGIDTVLAGFGDDVIDVNNYASKIFAGPGNDTVNGLRGDTIWGGAGSDSLLPTPTASNHVHEGEPPAIIAIEAYWTAKFAF